jgi:hypothetical protein
LLKAKSGSMSNFRIFTESHADIKFLDDYIKAVFNTSLSDTDFDSLGSWAGYKKGGSLSAAIEQNHANQKTSILILDADTDFLSRKNEVLNDFKSYNVAISLFLFPNNSAAGSLETLLCNIAFEKKLLDCFAKYETCIEGYETLVLKSKIFAYLDALLPANQKKNDKKDLIQEKNRDYTNTNHWDLNHPYLESLKTFLTPFLFPK